jgi:hypothetical protein
MGLNISHNSIFGCKTKEMDLFRLYTFFKIPFSIALIVWFIVLLIVSYIIIYESVDLKSEQGKRLVKFYTLALQINDLMFGTITIPFVLFILWVVIPYSSEYTSVWNSVSNTAKRMSNAISTTAVSNPMIQTELRNAVKKYFSKK